MQNRIKVRIKDLIRLYAAAYQASQDREAVGINDADRTDEEFLSALNQQVDMDLHDFECGLYCVSMLQEAGKLPVGGEAAASMAYRLAPHLKFNKTLHIFEEK